MTKKAIDTQFIGNILQMNNILLVRGGEVCHYKVKYVEESTVDPTWPYCYWSIQSPKILSFVCFIYVFRKRIT